MATQEKPTYDKERLKRDLIHLMQAVEMGAKRRPSLRYRLLRVWRQIIAFIVWPFQFRHRRRQREQAKIEYERIKGEILQAMQQAQAAILDSIKQAGVFLDELIDAHDRRKERYELLFASNGPLWSIGGNKVEPTQEMILSEWKFRFN